ncbi:Peptidase A1 domain-containing protein [Aphelenchoides fujianensis]|nr:Peptidase A1 domain-containing protein [Aphelenchoides fujianensis]
MDCGRASGSFQVSIEKPPLSAQNFLTGRSLRASRHGHQKFNSGDQNFADYADMFYAGNITIGTPPQRFQVRFDTACADVWVIDDTCTDVNECDGWYNPRDGEGYWKQKFHRSQSTTFRRDGRPLYLEDENSVVQGRFGVDTVVVGGISIEGQVFGMVDQLHGAFALYPFDGVVGLGWPSIAAQDTTLVF